MVEYNGTFDDKFSITQQIGSHESGLTGLMVRASVTVTLTIKLGVAGSLSP